MQISGAILVVLGLLLVILAAIVRTVGSIDDSAPLSIILAAAGAISLIVGALLVLYEPRR